MRRISIRLGATGVIIAAVAMLASQPRHAAANTSTCADGAANEGCMECEPGGGCSFAHPYEKSDGSANHWTCVESPGLHCKHGIMDEVNWTDE